MADEKIDLNKPVNFDYPEGFEEALKVLDFIPDEEERKRLLMGLMTMTM